MSIATALILACEPQRRFQNGRKASASFPLADEDHGTADEVQDQRQVLVAFAHQDLVDGDLRQVFQFGLGELSGKVTFDDVLG